MGRGRDGLRPGQFLGSERRSFVNSGEHGDTVIIGGGIAGLSAAFHLGQRGWRGVRLLEREPGLASHSSGRNAAIYRQLAEDAAGVALAQRTAALLDAAPGGLEAEWLRTTGALYFASSRGPIDALAGYAEAPGLAVSLLGEQALVARASVLAGGTARHGMWVEGDGVIDIHAVTEALARAVRAAGVRITTGCGVQRILVEDARVCGVLLDDGSRVDAAHVVNAAGAWSESLGEAIGAPLSLTPLRRHLAVLDAEVPADAPVLWDLDGELYFRPETGGVLASPCDETPWQPCLPPTSMDALELLGEKLRAVAPSLADLRVRRSWACLRTFAPDRQFVAGSDPRIAGLYWLGGFGGRGMTEGLAAGEVLAAAMAGEPHLLREALAPERLVRP